MTYEANTYTTLIFNQSLANAFIMPVTDVSAYKFISIHVLNTWSGAPFFQVCNDGTVNNLVNIGLLNVSPGQPIVNAITSNGMWCGFLPGKFFSMQTDGTFSGTITIIVELFTDVPPLIGQLLTVTSSSFVPNGAIPVGATNTGTNATVAASLAAAGAGIFNWCTGFEITIQDTATGGNATATLSGVNGGPWNYIVDAQGVANASNPLIVTFPVPVRSQLSNSAISLSVPALGAGTGLVAVTIHGYKL